MFEVYKKELKELLRDKKTLMFIIALPLLIFPLIFGVLGYFMVQAQIEADQEVHKYSIVAKQDIKDFSDKVFYHKNFIFVDSKYSERYELIQAVKDESIDIGIYVMKPIIGDGGNDAIEIEIIFNKASRINYISEKLTEIFSEYKHVKQLKMLSLYGISDEAVKEIVLEPVKLKETDTANARESIGEKLGMLLPYLLIPLVLTGASYPAIDLGAGEKERGTLETLLLTPITRTQIVAGKFLTIFSASIATSLFTVLSLGIWIFIAKSIFSAEAITDVIVIIGAYDLFLILLLLLPLACIFSSVVLAISIYSRSFKEAQNYMGPLSIVIFVPLAISMMPNMELTFKTSLIPIVNISLAIQELLKGTVDYNFVYTIIVSTVFIAAVSLVFCINWFKKEKVLFR
ncbi:ABC transporter permease [Pseudoalteromonas sp. NEC-BIFX-2020_002]|uniref:ABC transporter permease subunit n=1 Tax=Pseudoalteromonas neustonica TaxID=1840331 RepID=A0ABU9U5C4_9GAMM|nr:ABC transporter permease subunit [Pseudoalteromonas sp. NEC-BIFX-2020_002]NNG43707.1 ABC transporter permease [Pseudoalteromonas sp. NEC-BIFX-2020_002]